MMEMVRTQYEPQEEEVSVLVYVGHDFSRLIFMQGQNYLHFAPIISEGYESPNIENTIYSRILLEQDNIALTRIDRILLAGESHKVNLLEAIAPQFSSALVEYMKAPTLDIGEFEGSIGEAVSEYVIPIMTAWRTLQPTLPGFYNINLVPHFVLEGQRTLALAWHGWVMAILVSLTIPFFVVQITGREAEIRRAKGELTQKRQKLTELDVFRQRRAALTEDINRYSNATTVYDSIAPGSDRWSRILHYLANSIEDLNSLWIYSLRPDDRNSQNIIISGRSIYRARIPRIASIFETATLREVRTITIRKKILYEFDIVIEKVDKYDIPEPNFGTR
jgi:Tfp pilus assembly protein PilN